MMWMALTVPFLLPWGFQAAFAQSLFSPTQDPLAGSRVFGAKSCVKCTRSTERAARSGLILAETCVPDPATTSPPGCGTTCRRWASACEISGSLGLGWTRGRPAT